MQTMKVFLWNRRRFNKKKSFWKLHVKESIFSKVAGRRHVILLKLISFVVDVCDVISTLIRGLYDVAPSYRRFIDVQTTLCIHGVHRYFLRILLKSCVISISKIRKELISRSTSLWLLVICFIDFSMCFSNW